MRVRTYHAATPPGERWQHTTNGFVVELGGATFEVRQVEVDARGQVAVEITAGARRCLTDTAELKVVPVGGNAVRVEVHYGDDAGRAGFKCEHCRGAAWVGWAASPGGDRKAQCVPCGHVQELPESEVPA